VLLSDHRPRSATELVDVAVRIFARNYLTFLALTFVIFAPILLAVAIGVVAAMTKATAVFVLLVPLALALVVWFVVSDAAFLAAASDAYLGREIVLGRVLRASTSRAGSILAATLVKVLLICLGMVPLFLSIALVKTVGGLVVFLAVVGSIAWMILAAVRFFAAPGVVIYEGVDFSTSLDRSRALSKGSVGHIIGAMLLLWIIIFGIQIAVAAVGALAANLQVARIISQLAGVFTYPLAGITTTILYYDLRIRKEGLDIELAAAAT
jgi:hypothetical protein